MELCKTLEIYGFDLRIVADGPVESVVAKRTDKTQLTAKAASTLLLQLNRAQDEAIQYLRSKPVPKVEPYVIPQYVSARLGDIERALAGRVLSEWDEVARIYEWHLLMGIDTTSDGQKMIDCLNEARQHAQRG